MHECRILVQVIINDGRHWYRASVCVSISIHPQAECSILHHTWNRYYSFMNAFQCATFGNIHRSTVLICFDFPRSSGQIGNSDLQSYLAISAQSYNWAHGVVVSHPLSMREALGSIPSVSIFYFLWYHNFAMSAMHGWQNNIT